MHGPDTSTRCFPNLLIIGAQKCGTTSLHAYLDLHPDVHMAAEKELDFFIADRAWRNGADWYAARFRDDAAVRGEASPNYTALAGLGRRARAGRVAGARMRTSSTSCATRSSGSSPTTCSAACRTASAATSGR